MRLPIFKSITINSLRGSVTPFELAFERGKNLTIIYGENGTGKSTVADAFDLLGNGKVGSLDHRGIDRKRPYWASVGKAPSDACVILKTSDGECKVTPTNKDDVIVENQGLRPLVEVLRRNQILQLIEATAADRYAAISRFIDVSGVERSEAALQKLILEKKKEFDSASSRVSESRDVIDNFWNQVGSPSPTAIAWAERELQKDRSYLDSRKEAIEHLIYLWDKFTAHPEKINELEKSLVTVREAREQARSELTLLQKTMASDYLDVIELLKAAQVHLSKHPNPTVCPLCGSGEKAVGLAEAIERRIKSQELYGRLSEVERLLKSKEDAVQRAQQRVDDAHKTAAEDAEALATYCNGEELPSDIMRPNFSASPTDMTEWKILIDKHSKYREQWREQYDECVEDKKFIDTLRASMEKLADYERQAFRLEALLKRLQDILKLIQCQRKQFTDNVLSVISSRIGELYENIHPGEGKEKITLSLKEGRRASLDISSEFAGKQDAPPQAYFSDSHLDTLGLCIFLALAERSEPERKVLVLDDVLGSVDEPHVERIIELIYDAAKRFRHCIVTTHYGPWRHKYRWGWLRNGQCQFVELSRWSLQKGISHSRSIPEVERLQSLLAQEPHDLQAITAKSGVILEAILDFLTRRYECKVPRKDGNYTLGELLPAIDKKLREKLVVELRLEDNTYQTCELGPIIEKLERIAQMRNVMGCHFNTLSFDLLDRDALVFANEVMSLADALIDREVGWPMKANSGSYWATAGETRRLHPLKKPS